MTRSVDIAEFNLSDGLTPRQVDKLNHNFRQILRQLPQFMEGESGGGGDVPEDIADYILSTGIAQGWYYQLYKSGWLHAYTVVEFDISTVDWHVQTLALPTTMANTDYSVHVDGAVDSVERAYSITASNTVDDVYICLYNDWVDSYNLTAKVAIVIDGYAAGAIVPQGDRLPDYVGVSIVIPSRVQQILPTENKSVLNDITVTAIPEEVVDNPEGGRTFTIAS